MATTKYIIKYYDLWAHSDANRWVTYIEMAEDAGLRLSFDSLYRDLEKDFEPKSRVNFRIIKQTETPVTEMVKKEGEMVSVTKMVRQSKIILTFIKPPSDMTEE